jgi:hypothetical protein
MSVEAMITGDGLDFRLRERVVERAFRHRETMDDGLALKIINRLAESLGG